MKLVFSLILILFTVPAFAQSEAERRILDKYRPTLSAGTEEACSNYVKLVASEFHRLDSNWGRIHKPGGHNCNGLDCDKLLKKGDERFGVDIVANCGASGQSPSWQVFEANDLSVWRKPELIGGEPEKPTDPVPVPEDKRLDTIVKMLEIIILQQQQVVAGQIEQTEKLEKAMADLKLEIAKGIKIRW